MLSFWSTILYIHWLVWFICLFCVLLQFKSAAEHIKISDDLFSTGIFNQKVDVSDFEGHVYREAMLRFLPWLTLHPVIFHLIAHHGVKVRQRFYVLYTIIFSTVLFGWPLIAAHVVLYVLFYASVIIGWKPLSYAIACAVITHVHFPHFVQLRVIYYQTGEVTGFLTEVSLCWASLRGISWAVDNISKDDESLPSILDALSYFLYFPAFFGGPVVNYGRFIEQVYQPYKPWTIKTLFLKFRLLFRLVVWFVLQDIFSHYFFSSAAAYYVDDVGRLFDIWALCGLVYALMVQFHLKYTIIYGTSYIIASLEQIDLPEWPICVSRIHLCSQLWRYFDRGLYLWLVRYIYIPFGGGALGSAVSFSFVCLWHGVDRAVVVWCTLNFFGILLERLATKVAHLLRCDTFRAKYPDWWGILDGIVETPHFIFSIFSNVFFLANFEIGVHFLHKVILDGTWRFVVVFAVMYCGSRVSIQCAKQSREHKKDLIRHHRGGPTDRISATI